jgi:hypothetical protein
LTIIFRNSIIKYFERIFNEKFSNTIEIKYIYVYFKQNNDTKLKLKNKLEDEVVIVRNEIKLT